MENFDYIHATQINFDTSIALYAGCIFIIMNMCKHTHHMSMYLRGFWISWCKREISLGPIPYRLWKSHSFSRLDSCTTPSSVNVGVPNQSSINRSFCVRSQRASAFTWVPRQQCYLLSIQPSRFGSCIYGVVAKVPFRSPFQQLVLQIVELSPTFQAGHRYMWI